MSESYPIAEAGLELSHAGGSIQFECGLLYYPPSPSWDICLDTVIQVNDVTLDVTIPLIPEHRPRSVEAVTGRWKRGNGRVVATDENLQSVWEDVTRDGYAADYKSRLKKATKNQILTECRKLIKLFNEQATKVKLTDAFYRRRVRQFRERIDSEIRAIQKIAENNKARLLLADEILAAEDIQTAFVEHASVLDRSSLSYGASIGF